MPNEFETSFMAEKVELPTLDDKSPKKRGRKVKDERKDQFLKRIAKEQREAKKNLVVVGTWYEMSGDKIIKCIKKSSGMVYNQYVANRTKQPEIYKDLVAKGLLK